MTAIGTPGTLAGIARRPKLRAPMETLPFGLVSPESGLDGDARGAKYPRRQITVLALEDWRAACTALSDLAGTPDLPWTLRRANLLVEGLRLPRAKGAILAIGAIRLEVTGQTFPCNRMETTFKGLLSALAPDWRGGVTCRVQTGGTVTLGDPASVVWSPKEHTISLPG